MKYFKKISLVIAASVILFSCSDDDNYNFTVDKPESIAAMESVNQYDALKSYVDRAIHPGFKLGAGVMLSEYTSKGVLYRLINNNFDEITLGYEMKHGAIIQSDGTLELTKVNELLKMAQEAGISVFGHTLCWHANQNAAYLNSLLPRSEVNLWNVSGLASGNFDVWSKRGGADHISVENGNLVLKSVKAGGIWDLEVASPNVPVNSAHKYQVSFSIRSDKPGKLRNTYEGDVANAWLGVQYTPDDFETLSTTTEWKEVKYTLNEDGTFLTGNKLNINFLCGEIEDVTYYIKISSLRLVDLDDNSGGVGEDTDVEAIVGLAMENWMSEMITNCKPYVKAWDVVNEPMDDGKPYELKTGIGNADLPVDEFYWQDYLGKDYAVKAFQLARQYGNPDDKLFINDYNLEYNLDKCKGLIKYVGYIESKGAKVDGIGTQMHIDIHSNKENIDEMLRLLAATGKLIKISELDMGLGAGITAKNATEEQYKAQSEMYEYVIRKYLEIIPAGQQYGITSWSPLDSPENSSWRAGEPIGLWTQEYNRKHAYAGFANGLAGEKSETAK